MTKLLFLDFDGVLHPTHFVMQDAFSNAGALDTMLTGHDVGIVISSSWRFTYSIEELRRKLPDGIAKRVVGVTGEAVIGKHARYQEIKTYLNAYGSINWRALDDSFWEFPSPCRELIHCNPNTGISEKQVTELQEWLVTSTF